MINTELIDDIVSRIANKFDPDKIILFGSCAAGTPGKHSDIDLLIIQETEQPIQYRGIEIQKYLRGTVVPMDILVYTNSEYEDEKLDKYSFISSTLSNSKIIYERKFCNPS